MLRRTAAIAFAATLVLLVQTASSSAAAARNGVIAFQAAGIGLQPGLWSVGANGRGQKRLAQSPDDPREPAYSRNGRSIAVALGDGRDRKLAVLNAATGALTRTVPTPGTYVGRPAWSRDGRQLAFEACELESTTNGILCQRYGVYRVRLNGTGLKRLATGGFPAWSPDGRRIAYLAETQARGDNDHCPAIQTMSASNGRSRRTVVRAQQWGKQNCAEIAHPDFSPDGKRLLYKQHVAPLGPTPAIHSVQVDGRRTVVVFRDREESPFKQQLIGSARWSPDGRFVAYTAAGQDRDSGIWVVSSRGGGKPRRVSTALSFDVAWAPAR